MEARSELADARRGAARFPIWALAAIPLALIAAAIGAFALLDAPGVERSGPLIEELEVERTIFRPGEIELRLRNPGADPVTIAQVAVNDAYVDFEAAAIEVGRLGGTTLVLDYPWQEELPYRISILTSTGVTIDHEVEAAVETPVADRSFFALMALLGTYVGIIPVMLGMLFLPFLRRAGRGWLRIFLALTIGLLAFLAVDGYFEGVAIGGAVTAFGGSSLVLVGAGVAFLVLTGIDRHLESRRGKAEDAGATGWRLALMIAIGIGLHNLGEGLAIGTAYATGELALGAFLVIGFALHNTTEGFAIVAPLAGSGRRPGLGRLALLGLIAGGPAILGAMLGASVTNPELSGFLIGIGVGAIAQVIVQILPSIRDVAGRLLYPASVVAMLAGVALLYVTGLLIHV